MCRFKCNLHRYSMVGRMAHGGFQRASEEDRKTWVQLWDLFGPPGKRKALRTSKFAGAG
jgi:hypothetical protein